MATVARLAGALLAETQGQYYLVGNTKEPCDWQAAGFAAPARIDALAEPFQPLTPLGAVQLAGVRLRLPVEGEALPRLLAERLVIKRNGSVSERLWNLIVAAGQDRPSANGTVDVRWLGELPPQIWNIVQDTLLRCL
jgi:hypothetical protein